MKKILIVEDELAYVKLLRDQLTSKGFEVIEAKDGMEGLEKSKKEEPDLIILDIRMPKMDGLTMLKELRNTKAGKSIKVIVLTNLEVDDKILSDALETKPTYYFVKSDVNLDDILDKVEEVLA